MIYQAINCIRGQLRTFIADVNTDIGNIGEWTSTSGTDPDIMISLINIEESRISRDPRNYVQSVTPLGIQGLAKNPAMHLNLTLLFAAVKSASSYETALESLQKVILFFQGKYVFDHINAADDLDQKIEKLILEMVSMNTEQLNNIWSILGGKYHPSVVYRVRMVTLDSVSDQPVKFITEIDAGYSLK